MSSRIHIIFLLSTISCYMTVNTRITDTLRSQVRRIYLISQEETRTVYQEVKKHKKIIMSILAYLAFEGLGYSQGWDTPLRRLLTPKKLLDDALKECQQWKARYEALEKDALKAFQDQQEALMKELDKYLSDQ